MFCLGWKLAKSLRHFQIHIFDQNKTKIKIEKADRRKRNQYYGMSETEQFQLLPLFFFIFHGLVKNELSDDNYLKTKVVSNENGQVP
jgi:hypothetical protein